MTVVTVGDLLIHLGCPEMAVKQVADNIITGVQIFIQIPQETFY